MKKRRVIFASQRVESTIYWKSIKSETRRRKTNARYLLSKETAEIFANSEYSTKHMNTPQRFKFWE